MIRRERRDGGEARGNEEWEKREDREREQRKTKRKEKETKDTRDDNLKRRRRNITSCLC